jgi:LysM repeat protein
MAIDGTPAITPLHDSRQNEEEPSSGVQSSSTPTGQPAAGAGRDTKVFGNLEGRDPDLLFAGEKIMINGKEVTVADGDTLSSLAAKHGTTVDALIKENKMDDSLRGQNGPNGAYFTPGGPQPAPGGVQATPPNSASAASAANNGSPGTTSSGSTNSTPPRGSVPGALVDGSGSTTNSVASTPANQASGQSNGVWSSLLARDPGMNADNGVLVTRGEKEFGIFGGAITEARATQLLRRIEEQRQDPNSVFSSAQLDRLAEVIAAAPKGDLGMGLSAEDKYAINRLGMAGPRPIATEPTLPAASSSTA